MGWVIFLIIATAAVFAMMKMAGHGGRLSGSRGVKPAKICSCGLPRGKCQHLTRQAETAKGMGQKK